jgi:hypothetical protein
MLLMKKKKVKKPIPIIARIDPFSTELPVILAETIAYIEKNGIDSILEHLPTLDTAEV